MGKKFDNFRNIRSEFSFRNHKRPWLKIIVRNVSHELLSGERFHDSIETILEREPDVVVQKKMRYKLRDTQPKETKCMSYDNNVNVPEL